MFAVVSLTLKRFLEISAVPDGLGRVIEAFAESAIEIADTLRTAPIEQLTGKTGSENVQGEEVFDLDTITNDLMKYAFQRTGVVHAYVSEEDPEPTFFGPAAWDCYCDPADGSSNIDVGVPIGSILGVYPHKGSYNDTVALLRPGREMEAAAYVLYGSCTTLVLAIEGRGVQGFTLNPENGEFIQTHENIRFPEKLEYESLNRAYRPNWESAFVQALDSTLPAGLSSRYIGGLVPDFHRNLLRGGVFLYPGDKKNPDGKLRVMYEEAPIAKIAQAAGGLATNGRENTLDLVPAQIHARAELIVGPQPIVHKMTAAWKVLRSG
jgi:fructose-1,6-bisphosphatase I